MADIKKLLSDNFESIIKPVVVLLAICIIIPFALAGTNAITQKRIAELAIKQRDAAMSTLFADCEFTETEIKGNEYFTAKDDDALVGYIVTNVAKGYGGDVSVMTAINTDGTVKAVKILDVSNETPGLGQNVTKESFYSQFTGMMGEVSIKKNGADNAKNEVSPVTGATISSTAVKNAVNDALEVYSEILTVGKTEVQEVTADEK